MRKLFSGFLSMIMAMLFIGAAAIHIIAADALAQKVELKFATLYPPQDSMCIGPQYIFKELAKRSNGRVKVVEFYSQSLGKAPEMLGMLDKGVADIILLPPIVFPNIFIISDALGLPGLIPNMPITTDVINELEFKGVLDKDYAGYKVILWEGSDPFGIAFAKKKITNLADLRKLKIRAPAGTSTQIIEALGAQVVTIPTADIYTAMERGTVDACVTSPGLFYSSKLNEVSKYYLWKPLGIGANVTLMKKSRWESLPADVRALILELAGNARYYYYNELDKKIPDNKAQIAKLGVQVYYLDRDEDARWNALLDKYIEKWIAEKEAKKYPAREAVKAIKNAVKRFQE